MLSPALTQILSIAVIVGAAVIAFVLACIDAHRSGFTPVQYPIYFLGYWLTRVLWRTRIVGNRDLPATGLVLVANHRSPVDPTFLALAFRRPARWLVAGEYFRVPVFGWMLRKLQAIPTRRAGIDTAAVKQAIRLARAGSHVGVSPEGRLNVTDRLLLPLRNGASLIALEAGVPVVPCYIDGSPYDPTNFYSFVYRPAKVTITIGRPIDVSEYSERDDARDAHNELTRRIGREIAALAGRPDYEPELVSRRRNGEVEVDESIAEA
jgi:1-acyl-sn-glycerol-3-phosphate acyltransferase